MLNAELSDYTHQHPHRTGTSGTHVVSQATLYKGVAVNEYVFILLLTWNKYKRVTLNKYKKQQKIAEVNTDGRIKKCTNKSGRDNNGQLTHFFIEILLHESKL